MTQEPHDFTWNDNTVGIVFSEPIKNYYTSQGNDLKLWYGISKINLLVGPNNSGKSKLLREIMKANLRTIPSTLISRDLREKAKDRLARLMQIMNQFSVLDIGGASNNDIFNLHENINLIFRTGREHLKPEIYRNLIELYDNSFSFPINTRTPEKYSNKVISLIKEMGKDGLQELGNAVPEAHSWVAGSDNQAIRVYIPVLRGIRKLTESSDDYYSHRISKDYDLNTEGRGQGDSPVRVFSGLSMHDLLTDQLLGGLSEREEISKYQKFLSRHVFEGKTVVLIPPKGKQLTIKIGDEQEREIHHLGDGLQSILAITYLPFLYSLRQQPAFFFIEEPELFLHPGSQRRVIEILDELDIHTYFITTHSNHLLDLTIDFPRITISTVRKVLPSDEGAEKVASFQLQTLDNNAQSSLALLGTRNSSVFLVNATIWVEGITDRWYFRAMLDMYMRSLDVSTDNQKSNRIFREDAHFAFVEYGGANITHFSFLDYEERPIGVKTLCGEAMVIFDNDNGNNKARKDKLKERLGDRACELPCREVENLLPPLILRQIIAEYEGIALDSIPEIIYENYKMAYLGTYIEKKVLPDLKEPRSSDKTYREKLQGSGTIYRKKDFCEKALRYLKGIEFSDLPLSTQSLIENIYKHIRQHNPK